MTSEANNRLWQEAWDHVNRTGKKSTDGTDCCYGGIGCSFSVAIRPEFVALADEECLSPSELLLRYPGWLHDWAQSVDPSLADCIQAAHDHSTGEPSGFIAEFRAAMRDAAELYEIDDGGRLSEEGT